MKSGLRLLVCNDDGPHAPGMLALESRLGRMAEVWVITPDRERSATSHALSIRESLRLTKIGERRYTLTGYPADCANVGFFSEGFPRFDAVISGINHGPNLGDDVHYSGTVAAARQGAVHGIRACAVSFPHYDRTANADRAARWFGDWLERVFEELHTGVVYNVNYPEEAPGTPLDAPPPPERWTYQGRRTYADAYDRLEEGADYVVLRMRSTEFGHVREDQSDFEAVLDGAVSITPLSTYTTHIRELKRWFYRNPNANAESSNAS